MVIKRWVPMRIVIIKLNSDSNEIFLLSLSELFLSKNKPFVTPIPQFQRFGNFPRTEIGP